jgi:hypothetical protein
VKKNIPCESNAASENYSSRTAFSQRDNSESLDREAAQIVESQYNHINPQLPSTSITEAAILGSEDSSRDFLLESNDAADFNQMQLIPEPEASYFTPQPYNNFSLLPGDPIYGFPLVSGNYPQLEDPNFSFWDIDFDTVELAYQAHTDNTPTESTEEAHDSGRTRASKAAKRHAAFERSPWLFKPTSHDHVLNDQANLNLDEENISTALSPSNDHADLASFSKCCIDSRIRDQLLSIVLSMRRGLSKIPSFPSLELLNSIIRVFFVQESYRHNPLLHFGSFNPNEIIPELFMSIVSAGSTYISIPAVWKMGIALQDIGRHAIAEFVSFCQCYEAAANIVVGTKQQQHSKFASCTNISHFSRSWPVEWIQKTDGDCRKLCSASRCRELLLVVSFEICMCHKFLADVLGRWSEGRAHLVLRKSTQMQSLDITILALC